MYIVAASLLGNFALNVYVYLGAPNRHLASTTLREPPWWSRRCCQTRPVTGPEYKPETECLRWAGAACGPWPMGLQLA